MIDHNLCLDILALQEVAEKVIQGDYNEQLVARKVDTITLIAQLVSNNFELELTREQRQQIKQAVHGTMYGMSGKDFIKMLEKSTKPLL